MDMENLDAAKKFYDKLHVTTDCSVDYYNAIGLIAKELLNRAVSVLVEDTRAISWIDNHRREHSTYSVGKNDITSIVAYDETVNGIFVPWLAVYNGTDIYMRAPADKFSIIYDLKKG